MAITLYDTLSRSTQALKASDGKTFRFYCCGPTVYGEAHIGNFRTFLIQDTLRRLLEASGTETYHVRNITDVDDKTIRKSQEENKTLQDFTEYWTKRFQEDCSAFNMLEPHKEPKAASHIQEQIEMIESLIASGHAYVSKDNCVYYKVSSFEGYGKLTHLDKEHIQTQSTNSSGETNLADEYDRECVSDFALWKAHKPEDGDNAWESPWGPGRPGWHIECSAMAIAYLGATFDLHGGGVDLCFPHHENEIAQAEASTGKLFAHHWFHTAHLTVDGEKMSKSLGNLYTLADIKAKGFSASALRYTLIAGHYKQPLNFTLDSLKAATSALNKIEKAVSTLLKLTGMDAEAFHTLAKQPNPAHTWGDFKDVNQALENDLNIPAALGAFFKTLKELPEDSKAAHAWLESIAQFAYILGIQIAIKEEAQIPSDIEALAQERWNAKQSRDFAKADALRDDLKAKGWQVLDTQGGYTLEPLDQ